MRAPALGFLLALLAPGILAAQSVPKNLGDCDAMIREAPERPFAYRCHWFVARRLESWTETSAYLNRVLAREPDNHHARLSLALTEADIGNNREAFAHFRRAWEGFAERGDVRGEIYGRQGHAYVLLHQGGLEQAETILRDGEAAARRAQDEMLLAAMLVEQGVLGQRRGDFGWARNRFEAARRILDPSDPTYSFLRGRILTGLGEAARAMAEHEEALEYFEERAAMLHDAGSHYQEMFSRYDIASTTDILWRQGRAESETVRELAEVLLEGALLYHNPWIEGAARMLRARFLDAESARDELERASGLLLSLGQRELASRAFQHLARNAAERDELDEATRYGMRALELARESGDPVELALSYITLADVAWRAEPGEAARSAWRTALDAVEAIRDLQPDGAVRARSFADWSFAYYRFSSHLIRAHQQSSRPEDLELAFAVAERRRSRVLLEQLDAAHATTAFEARGALADERNALLTRIVEVQRGLLDTGLTGEARGRQVRTLEGLEREERLLRDAISRENSGFAEVRQPSLPSLRQVQSALAPDEAILSFDLPGMRDPWGELPQGWLQIVTRDDTNLVVLSSHEEIDTAVAMYLGLIQREDGTELMGARRLYDLLLSDTLQPLSPAIRRLLIVPDGILHRVPFAALAERSTDTRVFERFETHTIPSVAAWLRWRERRPKSRAPSALVLADPEPPTHDDSSSSPERSWALAHGIALGSLPHAREEGRSIVRLFGSTRSVLRVGSEASERFLKSAELADFPVIHVAAHGVLDETNPERSAILLSPGDSAEDGLLQLRDVADLDLSGKLVVLSACKSASGEVLQGEGVLGLGRAFFQAGAQSVVGSLWTLGDREGAAAFEIFYRSLADGASVATALRDVRLELAARGEPVSAWAGLVALGDAGFAPVASEPPWPRLPVIVVVSGVLLVSSAVALRSRKRWRQQRRQTE